MSFVDSPIWVIDGINGERLRRLLDIDVNWLGLLLTPVFERIQGMCAPTRL